MTKILLVDDSKALHAFVQSCLLSAEVELIHAYNGKEALEKISNAGSVDFDLVLLDWEMPIMDGPTALAQMKSSSPCLPVMMMSSRNSPEDISTMITHGAQEFVIKPFTADILIQKVEQTLGKEL